VGLSPATGVLRVEDEYLVPLGRDGRPKEKPQAFVQKVRSRIHLRMEGQAHPTYFDRYLDHSIISRPHYAPHYPHLTALKRELESWFFYYFEPRERMRAPVAVKEVRHVGLMGEELAAFLNTLKSMDPRQFVSVEKALHSLIPSITGIKTGVSKTGKVELSLIEGSAAIPARVVSEGTLRILGLLALGGVKEPPALIAFEEPENGVHPRRIRDVAKVLANRAEGETQVVVTTHSPVLADHVPRESLMQCRRTGAGSVIEPFDTWGQLGKLADMEDALEGPPVSVQMLRGDFDE